jgi:putative redox protein
MPTETVRVDWIADQMFLLRDRSGFPIVMTQPNGVNGADLLPLSLIGCAVWDVVLILRKQRQQITGVTVGATSERDDDPPWQFKRIRIVYTLTGRSLNAEHVRRAIELSEEKYCAIYATLRAVVELTSEFVLVEEGTGERSVALPLIANST